MTDCKTCQEKVDNVCRAYAHWYVREQLARRKTDELKQGIAALPTMKMLSELMAASGLGGLGGLVDSLDQSFFDGPHEIITGLADVGNWLVAEAEWNRMHAEALLRAYGGWVTEP